MTEKGFRAFPTARGVMAALIVCCTHALFALIDVEPPEKVSARVAADFAGKIPKNAAFVHYAVPAMSDQPRLPDLYPIDGVAGAPVSIILAKDEYEPGSFLVRGLRDLGKVQLEVTDLKHTRTGAVLAKENVDLKLVKVWWQNKNAWYVYFGDTGGFKLCPELLVNDEDLIRVDLKKQANYARIAGEDDRIYERWINPPRTMDRRTFRTSRTVSRPPFQPMKKGFSDAKTLQPVRLPKDEFRNFFLTVRATKDTPSGIYQGSIVLREAGKTGNREVLGEIPVSVTVLPFVLPKARTYDDLSKEMYICAYSYISLDLIREENGGDLALAKRQYKEILLNQVRHNQNMHIVRSDRGGKGPETEFVLDLMREVGMRTDAYVISDFGIRGTPEEMARKASDIARYFDEKVGHHNFYITYGDEQSTEWYLANRPVFDAWQKAGFKFFIAGGKNTFFSSGWFYDWMNAANDATISKFPESFGRVGRARVAWYGQKHIGVENPAFNRREYGMGSFLAGYSAQCNYAHHLGPYNDDSVTYRPMVFAYGTYDGVLDTIQWEGFREGVDDVRYASEMLMLAERAIATKVFEKERAGQLARHYLATFDRKRDDLNLCRMTMIEHILKLRELLGEKE